MSFHRVIGEEGTKGFTRARQDTDVFVRNTTKERVAMNIMFAEEIQYRMIHVSIAGGIKHHVIGIVLNHPVVTHQKT